MLGSLRDVNAASPPARSPHAGRPRADHARRSCLAVPGSSPRFLAKARDLAVDEVFLDLEDAVAPDAKEEARRSVIGALRSGGWGGKVRAVRINGATTRWAYRDVIDIA